MHKKNSLQVRANKLLLLRNVNFLLNPAGEGSEDASVDFTSGESAKQAGLHVLRAPDPSLRLRYFYWGHVKETKLLVSSYFHSSF